MSSRTCRVTFALLVAVLIAALSGSAAAQATVPGVNGSIAFSTDRTGFSQIYSQYLDSGNSTRLTNDAANDRNPASHQTA